MKKGTVFCEIFESFLPVIKSVDKLLKKFLQEFEKGRKITLAQWADETGISPDNIRNRLRYGWSVEEALTIPPGGKRKK